MFAYVTTQYDEWVARDLDGFDASYVGRAPLALVSPRVLDIDDVYPPVCKNMLAWHDVQQRHVDEYEWFVRCDQDAVLNREQLEERLQAFSREKPGMALYTGRLGLGRR